MRIYGSSLNRRIFAKYGIRLLEEAKMNYMKALPHVEIYLGSVFRGKIKEKNEGNDSRQIYLDFDSCYEKGGENAAAAWLGLNLCHQLGRVIQETYFSLRCSRWNELENMIGFKFDYNKYWCCAEQKGYCLATEQAAGLFDAAIKGRREITLIKGLKRDVAETGRDQGSGKIQGSGRVLKNCVKKTVNIDFHLLRSWFYSLWGQKYEWGCLSVNEKKAVANGETYLFEFPPLWIKGRCYVPAIELLQALGFSVSCPEGGKLEYWK